MWNDEQVLWPDCDWQPVSLTDLITSTSVKKVYRKATLCIHPDKVQQKGATIQQKYIAEKVFDILKVQYELPSVDIRSLHYWMLDSFHYLFFNFGLKATFNFATSNFKLFDFCVLFFYFPPTKQEAWNKFSKEELS